MCKKGKHKRSIIIILIIAGIASACASKNSSRTVPENSTAQEVEAADLTVPIPPPTTDDSMVPESDLQLPQEKREKIEFLLASLRHTIWYGSAENFLADRPILNDETEEIELERQARFLACMGDSQLAKDTAAILSPAVHSIDTEAETVTVTIEEANQLIRMAGGVPNSKLQSYLENEYHAVEVRDGLFTFYHYPEEVEWKHGIEEVISLNGGRIKVTGQSKAGWETLDGLPDFYLYNGMILDFEAILIPNQESIFGGYSVEHLWQNSVNPEGVGKVGEQAILQPYEKPQALSEYAFDYMFELEGDLYQMPFPVQEFLVNGWEIDDEGVLEPGERANIRVIKDGVKLSAAIWNYDQEPADFKDCRVVWLRTKSDHIWADVTFHVNGIKNESTVQSQPLKVYNKRDPLYNNDCGFSIHVENGSAVGFEIGYAPNPENRKERAMRLTEWADDPVYHEADSKIIEMVFNQIYNVDIDRDGKKEAIDLKYLDNVEWGEDRLCILVDGEVTALIGEWWYATEAVKLSLEDQGTFLYIQGHNDEAMEAKKILLHKKQSEEIQETGWRWIGEEKYYLEVENGIGHMATGWREIDGSTWYFDSSGKMLTGLQEIGGICYFLYPNGQLARTKEVEDPLTGKQYWADGNGVCTEREQPHQIEIGGQLVWSDTTELDLSNCGLSDLTPLASLTSLTKLDLENNQISDLTPLASLTNLMVLNLNGNQISDITPLQMLVKLRVLYIRENQISDLMPLQPLVNLEDLMLNNNQISDITPLQSLRNLRSLHFYGGKITDIKPLASLTKLEVLSCTGNQISDLSPLQNLTNLTRLTLWGNPISDVTPLESLTNIKWIDLEGTPLTQQQVDDLQHKLPDCKIEFPENPRIWRSED